MEHVVSVNRIRIDDFEKFHAARARTVPPAASLREVLATIAISCFVSPFIFTTFFVIPMMGQITVGFAACITALYLLFRRSLVIALTTVVTGAVLSSVAFMSIQSIKYRLDVTMFVLIALGIPVTLMYSVFVAMRIWELRGGAE